LEAVLAVQPTVVPKKVVKEGEEEEVKSSDEVLLELVAELQTKIPAIIERENFAKEILKINSRGLYHCHSTVLL